MQRFYIRNASPLKSRFLRTENKDDLAVLKLLNVCLPGVPFSWDPFPEGMAWGVSLSPFTSVPPWEHRSRESEDWALPSAPHSNLPASLRTVPGAEAEPSWRSIGSEGKGVRGDPEGLGGGTGEQEGAGSGETERRDTGLGLGVLEGESGEV